MSNRVPILQIDDTNESPEDEKTVRISKDCTTPTREEHDHEDWGQTSSLSTSLQRPPLASRLSADAVPVSIYRGSYTKSSQSLKSEGASRGLHSRQASTSSLRSHSRASLAQQRMERIMSKDTEFRDTYDLEELRDGFFDAVFVPPTSIEMTFRQAIEEKRLPEQQPEDRDRLSVRIKYALWGMVRNVILTPKGRTLLRACLAYLACDIVSLLNPTRNWVSRYSYFAPLAAILHHSGRSVGSQLELTVDSILGGCLGLGWGSLALYISTATKAAAHGYGGIHACSMIVALFLTSWLRAHFIRLHHGLFSFALALVFMETVRISDSVSWEKAMEFGVPYAFGLVVSLLVSAIILPDVGHVAIMDHMHDTLKECQTVVQFCGSRDKEQRKRARRELTTKALNFTRAFREMSNELTLCTLSSRQVLEIRNVMQPLITRLRSIPTPSTLFSKEAIEPNSPVEVLRNNFGTPAKTMIHCLTRAIDECSGYVDYLKRGDKEQDNKLEQTLHELNDAFNDIAKAYRVTVKRGTIFQQHDHEVLDIMLYIHYLYETSRAALKVVEMFGSFSHTYKRRWRLSVPIYPFRRGLHRATVQITHDRGGDSAAYYYQAKRDVETSFQQNEELNQQMNLHKVPSSATNKIADAKGFRYKCWYAMHRMQGFETRFALKAAITLTLLSLPAWIEQSQGWYSQYDSWMAPMMACVALHPRVGGNAKDLLIRSIFALIGAIWAGIVLATDNSYAIVVLSMVFMIPCMYRFILTSHPRSGLVGCITFTLISLSYEPDQQTVKAVWTRYLAIQAGLASSVLISWILWPFVARHEVRKSTASILRHISQCYQIVTDRYLYKDEDDELSTLSLQLGEVREARMLQNLRALEQLIDTTYHEPSLRGEFDPAPYRAMVNSCLYIHQKIADARISSIYFSVYESDADPKVTRQLVSLRRDTAASVIFTFYILANAFRSKHKVPQLLPSAAMSRKLLFDAVGQLADQANNNVKTKFSVNDDDDGDSDSDSDSDSEETKPPPDHPDLKNNEHKIWQMVHEAAFSRAFTDITEELEKMIAYSKYILGEERI